MGTYDGPYDDAAGTGALDAGARGWIVVAALTLGFAGLCNVVVALFAADEARALVALAVAACEVGAAFAVLTETALGRTVGIAVAGFAAAAQLAFAPLHPTWTLALALFDVFAVYALAMAAGREVAA